MPLQRNDLEQRMRALESSPGLRLLPHTWPVVRVAGRANQRYALPFRDYLRATRRPRRRPTRCGARSAEEWRWS